MTRPTYHLLALPHSRVRRDYSTDAFTIKVMHLARMMQAQGREVVLYATEGSEAACELVPCLTDAEFAEIYPGDHRKDFYDALNSRGWALFNERASAAINARKAPGDFVLSSYGWMHEPVTRATGLPTIEFGIGHNGSVPTNHRVFESYAWANYTYGKEALMGPPNFDAVVPNYFDPTDFPFVEQPTGDHFAFVGRLAHDKGWDIACRVAEALEKPIFLAGQGTFAHSYKGAVHVGTVGIEDRALLMGNALATFVPSQYVEPFGCVVVESLMCGTPVISSDFGAFPELVRHGEVGFRCRMFDDYVDAARRISRISRRRCREYAEADFGMARVSRMYDEYFARIEELHRPGGAGWYATRPPAASDEMLARARA